MQVAKKLRRTAIRTVGRVKGTSLPRATVRKRAEVPAADQLGTCREWCGRLVLERDHSEKAWRLGFYPEGEGGRCI